MKNIVRYSKTFYIFVPAFPSPSGEMVDTLVSGASASRRVGSTPIMGTRVQLRLDSFFCA